MIKLSKMSGKLKGIGAINTNTTSNGFCIKQNGNGKPDSICSECYSWRILKTFRKNAVPAFKHNSKVLSEKIIHPDGLPITNYAYFRFNGHGELINSNHFHNLLNICKKNKKTTFALWTKRSDIVKRELKSRDKPKNLILVYSNPKIDSVIGIPKGFNKVFNNVSHDIGTNCHGKCIDCLKCYNTSRYKANNVITEQVK